MQRFLASFTVVPRIGSLSGNLRQSRKPVEPEAPRAAAVNACGPLIGIHSPRVSTTLTSTCTAMNPPPRTTDTPARLFYDGACPLCSAEIRRLRQAGDDSLRTIDIHGPEVDASEDRDRLLRTLHYITPDGEQLVGLDANVAAWQHTRWGFAWRWLRWPVVRPVASWFYDRWAGWRYRRLYGRGGQKSKAATIGHPRP
jgi:predicted DCC family thiol-disulfide oxidoreductase YuxK